MTETEYVRCELTEAEVREAEAAMAREIQALQRLEDTKKQVSAELKAQIETAASKCRRLLQLVTNGYEYRDVEIEVILDAPERGQKTIMRRDTGGVVRVAAMDEMDGQDELALGADA